MNEFMTQLNNCIGLKEPITSKSGKLSADGLTYQAVLVAMLHTPCISREVISYYFPQISYALKFQLTRLQNKGFVKSLSIKRKGKQAIDGRTKTIYVLTKKGYDQVVDLLLNPPQYYQIRTDTYLMHYYAASHIFYALLKRGVYMDGYHLEKQLGRFSRTGVQNNDLFCDVACYTRSESLFFEQDMGTERIPRLIDKLERYDKYAESLNEKGRIPYLIMLFKEPYQDYRNLPCFNTKVLKQISEVLDTAYTTVGEYYLSLAKKEQRTEVQSSHFTVLYDLLKRFPYMKSKTSTGVLEFIDGIDDFTGKEYYRALNQAQARFTYKKRQAILKEYYNNYMSYYDETVATEQLYTSFKFFKENMQCYLWSSTGFSQFLQFFYESKLKIEPLVTKYFPDAVLYNNGYWTINKANMDKIASPVDRADRGLYISTCNTYVSGAYHICIEFPTLNIGSFVRILHLRQRLINFGCGINIYLGVLNKDEAIWISDLLRLNDTPHFGNKVYTAWHTNFYFFNISDFKRLYTLIDNEPFYIDKVEVK